MSDENRHMAFDDHILADWPAPDHVLALTTTRRGGFSGSPYKSLNLAHHVGDAAAAVERNRRRLTDLAGIVGPVQWLRQVHGTDVHVPDPNNNATVPEADAVVLIESGTAGAVMTADCLPVFFCSRSGHCAGVAHAGWRGLAAGVLERTLEKMAVPASEVHVWLGPAIGPCHFEVGEDVLQAFMNRAGSDRELQVVFQRAFVPVHSPQQQKWLADLYGLSSAILHSVGVHSIHGGGFCTYCDERFFSYRRQPVTGRMASLICLKPMPGVT